jgi:hypothetical protein
MMTKKRKHEKEASKPNKHPVKPSVNTTTIDPTDAIVFQVVMMITLAGCINPTQYELLAAVYLGYKPSLVFFSTLAACYGLITTSTGKEVCIDGVKVRSRTEMESTLQVKLTGKADLSIKCKIYSMCRLVACATGTPMVIVSNVKSAFSHVVRECRAVNNEFKSPPITLKTVTIEELGKRFGEDWSDITVCSTVSGSFKGRTSDNSKHLEIEAATKKIIREVLARNPTVFDPTDIDDEVKDEEKTIPEPILMDSIDETDTTTTIIVPTITPDLTTCTLRPSQAFILRNVHALALQMLTLVFIKAPGGIGKTVVAARVIYDRFVKGTVSLLFAPASHLVDAVTAILRTTNLSVLPVYGGSGGAESLRDLGITTDVIVSTYASADHVMNALTLVPNIVIRTDVTDEAHNIASVTDQTTSYRRSMHIISGRSELSMHMTATPGEGQYPHIVVSPKVARDEGSIVGISLTIVLVESVVKSISFVLLGNIDFLSTTTIKTARIVYHSRVPKMRESEAALREYVTQHKLDDKVLIFGVDGNTSQTDRQILFDALLAKTHYIIVCVCMCFRAGFNSYIDGTVLTAGMTVIDTEQVIYRPVRKYAGRDSELASITSLIES